MALTTAELMLVEQRVTNDGPSTGAAYLLWFFLWFVSGHRFYLGRPGTAILQIVSYFFVVGFIWLLVDAFLIPEMIREKRNEVRSDMMRQLMAA
ncbi:MAG: TM2 domain-containing protein [Pseudomonadota bacterium]